MAPHAWLDSLSEDWVSQPRDDSSQAQLSVFSDSRAASQQSDSRAAGISLPTPSQSIHKPDLSTTDALGERSSNNINIQASQRQSSRGSDDVKSSQRGRHISRSHSASASGSVQHNTIEHKSLSASPAKNRADIPEWRRRLLHREGDYAEPLNLFSSAGAGLESMFRPPPRADAIPEEAHDEDHTAHDMTMPSSPPPYFKSRSQNVSGGTFEESSLEFSEIQPALLKQGIAQRINNENDSGSSMLDNSFVDRATQSRDDATKNQGQRSSISATSKQYLDVSRRVSGRSDTRNEDFSPIYLTRLSKEDGKITFAPTELSADSLRKRLDEIRQDHSFMKSDSREQESTMPQDDLDSTQDYARQGAFLNIKRGGYSAEGSFRRRPLSPAAQADTSEMLPESSLQASTPKHFPATIRIIAPTESNDHTSSESPDFPRGPDPSPDKRPEHSHSIGGSPLKLFGPYDTFTNQTLMRRISQFEDPVTENPSYDASLDNSHSSLLSAQEGNSSNSMIPPTVAGQPRKQQLSCGHDEVLGIVNNFGAGDLDDYVFSEDISLGPVERSELRDKENVAPIRSSQTRGVVFDLGHKSSSSVLEDEELKLELRRTRTSTNASSSKHSASGLRSSRPASSPERALGSRFVLGTPKRDSSETKRPRTSPSKDPTPKRRRTLHRSDIAYGLEAHPAAIEAVRNVHCQMQSGIGRKRKDARPSELQQSANSAVMANRQVIRPRTPTPSQRSSVQREQEFSTGFSRESINAALSRPSSEGSDMVSQDFQPNGSRRVSIKTQDFFVEAEKIMAMIRNKARPSNLYDGLDSVDESKADISSRRKTASAEESYDDSYEDSFQEPFLRPPSREGGPVLHLATRQQDPAIADKLKQYEEKSDMGDLITYSMRSMGLAKEATREVKRLNKALKADLQYNHTRSSTPEEGEVISDLSNVRLSRNPDASIDDELGPIASHGSGSSSGSTNSIPTASSSRGSEFRRLIAPDAVSQVIGDHVGNMQLDKEKNVWMKVKTPRREPLGLNILPSEDSEEDPFASIPDLSVDVNKEKQHLNLKTGPLDDLQEYVKEDFPHPPASGKKPTATDKPVDLGTLLSYAKQTFQGKNKSMPDAAKEVEEDEEVEHEITLDEDRVQKSSPARKRNLTITFSSPVASFIQDALPQELHGDTTIDEISAEESLVDDDSAHSSDRGRGVKPGASAIRNVDQSRSRSRSKSVRRSLSVRGRTFIPRPVSRIDEQDEETAAVEVSVLEQGQLSILGESSVILPNGAEQRRNSVSFLFTTPAPIRQIPQRLATPIIAEHVGMLSLSPLSELTFNHGDRSNALEVSYVVGDDYLVTGDKSKRVMSQAIRALVEKITEVEPFEPDWDSISVLNINGKRLGSLHKLDEFCGSIVTMDASDNLLSHLDGVPPSVRNLKITHNHLSELTAWGHLLNLQYVDISNNQINSLHAFKDLVHLRNLRADNNLITGLDGIKFHDSLQVLRARNNMIEEVDLEGTRLHRLTELDLQGNHIRAVANIEQLSCLSTLNLEDNYLTSFATTTDDMPSLRYLQLSGNAITELSLASFPSLRLLHADRNQLTTLKGFSRTRRLDSLSLREQRGEEPLNISFLTAAYEVRKLFLSGNLLATFDPKVDFLNLQYLELANCGLQSLGANFGQLMPNLRTLNLNFNALEDLSALRFIPRLKKLLVAGNRLSDTIALANLLPEFPHLAKLDLRDNIATLGFYPPIQSLVSVEQESDLDPFVLPDANKERDDSFSKRLDLGTKQKRRFYEIAVTQRCGRLKTLDGLSVDRQRIRQKDHVWQALLDCGVISHVSKKDTEGDGTIRTPEATGETHEI
ncbi:hypothetical protein PFICI_09282 [Pestalotiopsis fici W106-1]|uniref:Septation initiation network scaffold protein cdc11 n=1 Tax=Pestalotiopsis fici (strain W106-1 / CGMCC3.15140) TaxID=1229662 RepID=W3X077_PESFW|nr:uncharacterized protein PFICI_09282 [Pestalotiopsis fici W106-1]ETS79429.1 hypothetical protein PFICI_09282 [Pestalotiopsis fici W106-1]